PSHLNGGETSRPIQVYLSGILPPLLKAVLDSLKISIVFVTPGFWIDAMYEYDNRVNDTVAKTISTITVSLFMANNIVSSRDVKLLLSRVRNQGFSYYSLSI
ncbi:MAG: hypothetical protein LZ173_09360, partial [Thaumarchaeota archaeon]|nr:hypothetical protein [Candidatus Geocrenenecus arthurdayi]